MVKNMIKAIKITIIILTILILGISGTFAYLYLGTDMLKTDKQMFLKYFAESQNMIYNHLKDEDLEAYKKKLKNTPYEKSGKISVIYDTENSEKTREMQLLENSNITITGKVDKANKINLQNIKVNYPQSQSTDIDLLIQDDTYGFRINSILKNYVVLENNNLKEWAEKLGLKEEQINLIPNKIDSTFLDSIISEDEANQLIKKYTNIVINSLNDDMFSKNKQENITIYSLKINETQLKSIAKEILNVVKDDEDIWQILRKIFINYLNYSEEELNEKIEETKKELEESIKSYTDENKTEDDIDGNTLNDTSKEDKIYVYNLHLNNKELVKVESINDDESQVITKTENGILIESKDKNYYNEENTTTINIDKKKDDEKLIYNLEMKGNSELLGSLSIGYRGLNTLNQVEEVAVLNYNLDLESENSILQKAKENEQKNKSNEEKEEIMLSIMELYTNKMTDLYSGNDTNITLNDLKNTFAGKNFEILENGDGTFKIISKSTNNEYTITPDAKVETKEAPIQENISTTPPKRKIQYFNKNTFNENLQIKRIEENEMWKMNGKDAKQIGNVFNNISKKMEDINKEQMQNYTPYEQNLISESYMLKLIPYFSIVGIDNIEYEQITVRNTFLACAGITGGIFKGMEFFIYNQAFNSINN